MNLANKYLFHKIIKLTKHFNFKEPILDCGCGTGEVMLLFKGKNIEGIDFSEQAITEAKKKGLNVKLMDVFKLNKRYNSIICIDLIEHLKDDDKFLKKIQKSLYSNGQLFLLTPSGKMMNDDIAYGHYRRYAKKELKKKIENYFDIEHIEMFGYPFLYYGRIAMNKISKLSNTSNKMSGCKSAFENKKAISLINWMNNRKIFLWFMLLQNLFLKGNKGLAILVIAKKR